MGAFHPDGPDTPGAGAVMGVTHTGGMDDPLLPDITRDETDAGWGDRPESDCDADERILREIPPHHGD